MDMRDLQRKLAIRQPQMRSESPPYFDVTDDAEDQWAAHVVLGGEPRPMSEYSRGPIDTASSDQYGALITEMWRTLGVVLVKTPHRNSMGCKAYRAERLEQGLKASQRNHAGTCVWADSK